MIENTDSPFRLLLVDDDESVAQAVGRTLRVRGFEVSVLNHPHKGIQALEEHANSFDAVIVDLNMPDMDGLELLRRVREICPELPAIMLTAVDDASTAVEALRRGAVDYLTKPLADADAAARLIRTAALNGRLTRKLHHLEGRLSTSQAFADIIGTSPAMQHVLSTLQRVAPLDVDVLIEGESGTGKELIARAIHARSRRAEGPFLAINCGAIPDSLVDSALFGHKRGSFTGAFDDRPGAFEMASGGTLFLDEIGDISPGAQTRLLRALQERVVMRVGSSQEIAVDVRVIAATNADLEDAISNKEFREDLYYRLNVVNLDVPPLRARPDDIPLLAAHFVGRHSRRMGIEAPTLSSEAIATMCEYNWPGNVRELENAIQSALVQASTGQILPESLPARVTKGAVRAAVPAMTNGDASGRDGFDDVAWADEMPLPEAKRLLQERFERAYLQRLLDNTNWNVSEAARRAGIDRSNFRRAMRRCGLRSND